MDEEYWNMWLRIFQKNDLVFKFEDDSVEEPTIDLISGFLSGDMTEGSIMLDMWMKRGLIIKRASLV